MTIDRVYPPGWGLGEKFTSAQANALDIQGTYALDKRAGQTDALASLVSWSGAGRIIYSFVNGADANTTYQADGGNRIIRVTSAVTANRNYSLSATNAVAGDIVEIYCESSFAQAITVKDQAAATIITLGPNGDALWASFIYMGGGWRLFEGGLGPKLQIATFTANGNWTCPNGVNVALILGYGGGGGGGAAFQLPGVATGVYGAGGAGGGGALESIMAVAVTPGTVYAVTIGPGGTGGNTSAVAGGDGGDTTFGSLATFCGASGGGSPGSNSSDGSTTIAYAFGGGPTRGVNPGYVIVSATGAIHAVIPPSSNSHGGLGADKQVATGAAYRFGGRNPKGGFAGGSPGTNGADATGIYRGGGAGGGGGAGPGGAGGNGGNGSAGVNGGVSAAPGNGVAGGANTGAGGGGGGAPGAASAGSNSAGTGGNGGSGKLSVLFVR